MGRVYIPQQDMADFGVSEADLGAERATPALRELIRFEVQRTREYFRRGVPLIDSVRGRLRVDLRLFTLGGLAVLDAIERQRYDVLSHRPAVSKPRKLWLGVRALAPLGAAR
jgi:phytoene/squalene synthetase